MGSKCPVPCPSQQRDRDISESLHQACGGPSIGSVPRFSPVPAHHCRAGWKGCARPGRDQCPFSLLTCQPLRVPRSASGWDTGLPPQNGFLGILPIPMGAQWLSCPKRHQHPLPVASRGRTGTSPMAIGSQPSGLYPCRGWAGAGQVWGPGGARVPTQSPEGLQLMETGDEVTGTPFGPSAPASTPCCPCPSGVTGSVAATHDVVQGGGYQGQVALGHRLEALSWPPA